MVIEYASRSLTKREINYGITEKEALAIKWGINYFQYYLRGRSFIVKSNHKALEYMQNQKFNYKRINR